MPSGKRVSKEIRAEILRLRAQGLTYKIIAIRTGLRQETVYRIVKEGEREGMKIQEAGPKLLSRKSN